MFTQITIVANRRNPDGSPASGRISFQLTNQMVNDDLVAEPSLVAGILNAFGSLVASSNAPLVLLANDDDGTLPADPTAAYQVTESINAGGYSTNPVTSGRITSTYYVYITHTATITDTAASVEDDSATVTLSDYSVQATMVGQPITGTHIPSDTTVVSIDAVANTLEMSNPATGSGTESVTVGGCVDLATLVTYTDGPSIVSYIPWVPGSAEGDYLQWNGTAWVSSSSSPGGVESVAAADDSIVVTGTSSNPLLSAAAAIAAALSTAEGYTDDQISDLAATIATTYLALTGGTLTGALEVQANLTVDDGGQIIANDGSSAKMRLGQKANSEIVWSYNVDQNNGDAIDDPTVSAFKFSMQGTEGGGYDGLHLQYAPPNAEDGWGSATTVFTVDGSGDVWMDGTLTTVGGMAADLDMNDNQLSSLAQADAAGQAVEYEQWQEGVLPAWFQTGVGSPLGVVAPETINALYFDTASDNASTGLWVATAADDNESWASLGTNGNAGFLLYNAAGGQSIAPIVAAIGNISDGQPVPVLLAMNSQYLSVLAGNGSPVGVVTPSFSLPNVYFDLSTPAMWQSNGSDNTDWVQTAGAGLLPPFFQTGSGSPQGVVTPYSIGCLYFDTSGEPGGLWAAYNTGVDNWISLGALYGTASGITFGTDGAIGIVPQNGQTLYLEGGALYGYWPGAALLFAGSMEIVANDGPIELVTSQALSITVQSQTVNVFVYPGNPNGVVTAIAAGDVCVDTATPTTWHATDAGTDWIRDATLNSAGNLDLAGGRIVNLSQAGAAGEAVEYDQWQSENATLVPQTTEVVAGTGLSGGGALSGNVTLSLPAVGTAGTYGDASHTLVATTDAEGRVSGVTVDSIAIAASQVTSGLAGTYAPLASPAFTGDPTTPDATALSDNEQIANTKYVDSAVAVETAARKLATSLTPGSIGFLGDSITYYNFATLSYGAVPQKGNNGYATWAGLHLDQRFTNAYNDGVPGAGCLDSTWPQRVANFIATGLDVCVLFIGTNDVKNGYSFSQVVNGTGFTSGCGLAPTISALRAAGITVVIGTLFPRENMTVAESLVANRVNSWIREQSGIVGIHVWDGAAVLTDAAMGAAINTALGGSYVPDSQWKGTSLGTITGTVSGSSIPVSALSAGLVQGTYVKLVQVVSSTLYQQYFYLSANASAGATSLSVTASYGTAPSGGFTSGALCYTTYSIDGVHPNTEGARLAGKALARVLDPLVPRVNWAMSQSDAYNLFENAIAEFTTTANQGGGSGGSSSSGLAGFPTAFASGSWYWATVPGGYTYGPTVTQIPRTDEVPGNWTVIDIPAGESGVLRGYVTTSGAKLENFANLYAGDVIVWGVEIGIVNQENPPTVAKAGLGIESYGAYIANPFIGQDLATTAQDFGFAPSLCVLQTPEYMPTWTGNLSSTLTEGDSYTAIPLEAGLTAAIPDGSVLLLQDDTGLGQFVTVSNGGNPVAIDATSIPVVSFTAANNYYLYSNSNPAAIFRTTVTPIAPVVASSYTMTSATTGTWTGVPPTAGTALTAGTAVFTGSPVVGTISGTTDNGTFTITGTSTFTSAGTVIPAAVTGDARYLRLNLNGGMRVVLGRVWATIKQAVI